MSTNKKIKTDNKNKIFQDIIDFEILRSIINYLLISKKNKKNNNNNNNNQYKINKFYLNRNEILNYILVSKKWYNFISLTISNNIINNKLFEHWLEINYDNNNNNKSFIENYNNQNQYDKNNLIFIIKNVDPIYNKQYKIRFNKEFSIIKIQESIINDYFKFNLFLNNFTIDDFKEIKNKFENNQLVYNRIVVNVGTSFSWNQDNTLFGISKYISNENSEIISNLFKILELDYGFSLHDDNFIPDFEEEEEEEEEDGKGNKKCGELYFNNFSIAGYNDDEETVKIFKIFKGKNIIYDASDCCGYISPYTHATHINYSALFDPHNSGQQVESIKVINEPQCDIAFVEARHLIKVNQFENLHSITIPINSYQILSELWATYSGDSELMKSELNQMINSIITCKSLKNLKISSIVGSTMNKIIQSSFFTCKGIHYYKSNEKNEAFEYFSNSFKPLFSESNTSIERIEFDCASSFNINTFSNLLNNKSIKYLYLYNSDFTVYSFKLFPTTGLYIRAQMHKDIISINQYLFENIFSSALTSIRHYKIKFKDLNEINFIFNLLLNNIFKLQLYSIIFELDEKQLIIDFFKEYKNLINYISTQQQKQQQQQQLEEEQQKSNKINLKEIKIIIKIENYDDECFYQELNNQYFTTVIKLK
ncbi:hypothetical protein ACTFIZ_001941 [Dictyostelium cf. discoideum]